MAACRYRSLSKPAFNLLKSTVSPKPTSTIPPSLRISPSSPSLTRSLSSLGALQSLLPLHSAVSSARLTSCLGIDSISSRSLSQGELSDGIRFWGSFTICLAGISEDDGFC